MVIIPTQPRLRNRAAFSKSLSSTRPDTKTGIVDIFVKHTKHSSALQAFWLVPAFFDTPQKILFSLVSFT